MGLLDDAIREHLDLKRRRGADPAEVEQQEREALGPVRGAAPATAEQPELPDAEPEPYDDDEPEALPGDPEPAPLAEPPEPAEHHGAVRAPDPPEHVSQPTQQYSVDELEEMRREAEQEPEPEPRSFTEPPEDVVPADEEPEAEDVLDETPEFLQEAPEHDRLWFEQRPPRDFDF